MRKSSNTLNLIIFYRLPVILFCLLIFWQSSFPGIISKPLFPHEDKVLHFFAYALLAILSARSLMAEKPSWPPIKITFIAIVFTSLYGLSDEIHQAFVPARFASVYDFIADCAGSILGCLFYQTFIYRKK